MTTPTRPKFRYAGQDDFGGIGGVNCETVLELFRAGHDTAEIAKRFQSRSESTIYNALHHAREQERPAKARP